MGDESTVDNLIERVQPDLVATRRAPLDLDEAEAAARLQAELFGEDAEALPLKIGRYAVTGRLGRGGMGVVFAAIDTQLDRKVALKALRKKETIDPRRLRREARTLAQLSHPNIVEIYDVGVDERGEVYVVLEHVQGRELERWIREERPDWREIVDVMIDAGQGLSAAHQAGVIHRDFKPSNLLVDRRRRARVLDFGLAVPAGYSSSSGASDPDAVPGDRLTVTGAVLGTPSYMAPEQHMGHATDERTDQYAFCVTLFEALYGRRPFLAQSSAQLLDRKRDGPPPRPSEGVPRSLHDAIARGLAFEPEARWPSMDALLDRLAAIRRRRPELRLGAAVLAVAGGVAALAAVGEPKTDPCEEGRAALAGAWSDEAKARVQEAFRRAAPAAADSTFERAGPLLDAYAEGWGHAFDEWCAATDNQSLRRDHELSCLRGSLDEFIELVEVLGHADAVVVENAVTGAANLPAPVICKEPAIAMRALPENPTHALEFGRLRSILSRARAESAAGRYAAAQALIEQAAPALEALGEPRLEYVRDYELAVALQNLARFEAAVELYERAHHVASAAGDDDYALKAAQGLTFVLSHRLEKVDAALEWARHGEAALEHGRLPERIRANFLRTVAIALFSGGRFEEAKAKLDEALEIRRSLEVRDDLGFSFDYEAMAGILRGLGEMDLALEASKRSLEARLAAVGPDHPDYGLSVYTLAVSLAEVGRTDEAEAKLEEALAVRRRLLPADHPDVVDTVVALGTLASRKQQYEKARARYEEAYALAKDMPGSSRRMALTGLGVCARHLGDHEAALAAYREVEDEAHAAGKREEEATAVANMANVFIEQKRYDEALDAYTRARQIAVEHYGPAHPLITEFEAGLAGAHMLRGDTAEGEAIFEQALTRLRELGDEPRARWLQLSEASLKYRNDPGGGRRIVNEIRSAAEAAGETHNVARADAVLETFDENEAEAKSGKR